MQPAVGNCKELEKTIYDSLVDGMLWKRLVPSVMENLLVAPSNSDLLSAEMFLGENEQGKTRLKRSWQIIFGKRNLKKDLIIL